MDNVLEKIITKKENSIRFSVRAVPNASKCEMSGLYENSIRIRLDVPPVEGKANEKCVKFLSKFLKVPKTNITIVTGDKNKNKIFEVKGDPDELFSRIRDELADKI